MFYLRRPPARGTLNVPPERRLALAECEAEPRGSSEGTVGTRKLGRAGTDAGPFQFMPARSRRRSVDTMNRHGGTEPRLLRQARLRGRSGDRAGARGRAPAPGGDARDDRLRELRAPI